MSIGKRNGGDNVIPNPIHNAFIAAVTSEKVDTYRIYAKMPDGRIGITAEYTASMIEVVKEDILSHGHEIIKVERIQH